MDLSELGQGGVNSMKNFLQQPAENYGNDTGIELQWAMKAFHHAEVYFSLIKTVDPTILKLTPMDTEIYTDFREKFPDTSVEVLDEETIKSTEGKAKWREFCEAYKGRVEDYNMGSLLRLNANEEVSDTNTTLVPRIQFLAIEISRNREGYNSALRQKFGVASKKDSTETDSDKNANTENKESGAEGS